MESLEQRRESMALKFVKSGLKDHNFSKLFPLRKANHGMTVRNSEKYHVKSTKNLRYKVSAVPFLQRLLTLKRRKIFWVILTEGVQLCPHTVSLPEPAHFGAALHYPPLSH